ncbi:MAG: DUF4886 domain-containing protein [Lentisphaeria bacterium]|nr:DUF4886 domain-containing protein [Lentisphaeria bacterium]
MNRYALSIVVLLALTVNLSAKELKVLMIGNSFSICVGKYLPQIVNAGQKHHLVLTSAYIGGCPLKKHYEKLLEGETAPKQKPPYKISVWDSAANIGWKDAKVTYGYINGLIKNNQYDIITVQQASRMSFDFKSYEPYIGELIKYIRKYQKNAEVVIQQTWAYREDFPGFSKWGFDQQGMYERICSAYRMLAEKYQLRIIPMADAVQNFRADTPVKYQRPDPNKKYKYPELPSFAGDVVGVSLYQTNKKTKEKYVHNDYSHLNNQGHYLQAACWYAFLFNEDAEKITFAPADITKQDAELLRKCAAKAVKNYKQIK